MSTMHFRGRKQFREEWSRPLRRANGGRDGVQPVNVDNGMAVVAFDEQRIGAEDITRITRESIEHLG